MKLILFLFFIILCINSVNAYDISLNYTDTSETYKFSSTYQYYYHNITTDIRNHIYYITNTYSYGIFTLSVSNNYHNISFYHDDIYHEIIVNIDVTSKNLFWIINDPIGRNINYTFFYYKNGVLYDTVSYNYDTSSITCQFGFTKYSFNDNQITIEHTFSSLTKKDTKILKYNFINDISLSAIIIDNNFGDNYNFVYHYIEYADIGTKPKSYYINQLIPILQIPYKNIGQHFDKSNDLLNIFLILSYLLKGLFFWLKVIYVSFFTLLFLFLIGVIPFVSYITSTDRKTFIFKLTNNYKLFIKTIISIMNHIINLILKGLEIIANLIPFT